MKLFKKNLLSGDADMGMDDVIDVETAEIISGLGTEKNAQTAKQSAPAAAKPSPAKKQPAKTQARTQPAPKPVQKTAKPVQVKYGIQEAIELVNTLPVDTPEIVVPVVVKTLESAGIQLTDIIVDAEHHEEIIETQSIEMLEKIEMLESQISKLNDEVMTLNTELEQTSRVKNLLKSSLPKASKKK